MPSLIKSTIRPYFSTRKPAAASPSGRPFLMSTTTTRKPVNKPKTKTNSASAGWNTARPEFNPFQLDPSLLHNGFLFDKRQMQTQLDHKMKRPAIVTTARPIFRTSPTQNSYYHQSTTLKPQTVLGQKKTVQSITFKPRLTTSTK